MTPLELTAGWDVPVVCAAVFRPAAGGGVEVVERHGDTGRPFRLASISKLLTAYALVVADATGTVSLDDPAGPPGSTLRHLLAHASGLGFESSDVALTRPESRRIYSNAGIEAAADHLARAIGVPFDTYLLEAVLLPLGMTSTSLYGSPAHDVHGTVDDLGHFAAELFAPRLVPADVVAHASSVQFPGLSGVLPGVGRFDPCDWGLGFERNFGRPGHWAGERVSREAVGHFGAAGTFFWADPGHRLACVCLTNRAFDTWALEAWPPLCDAVIDTYSG